MASLSVLRPVVIAVAAASNILSSLGCFSNGKSTGLQLDSSIICKPVMTTRALNDTRASKDNSVHWLLQLTLQQVLLQVVVVVVVRGARTSAAITSSKVYGFAASQCQGGRND